MKFITATTLVLGLAFYQLSGGNNFEPRTREIQTQEVDANSIEDTQTPVFVAKTTAEIDVVKVTKSELRVIKASVAKDEPVKEMPSILMASLNTASDAQEETTQQSATEKRTKEVRIVRMCVRGLGQSLA